MLYNHESFITKILEVNYKIITSSNDCKVYKKNYKERNKKVDNIYSLITFNFI